MPDAKKWANSEDGSFKRQVSSFRETISASHPVFKPGKGRYWLYVSLACPWAHRTLITRVLKGLTSVIGVSVVHWHMDEKGWRFLPAGDGSKDKCFEPSAGIACTPESQSTAGVTSESTRAGVDGTPDHNYGFARLSDLYYKAKPDYQARFTVPILWDLETETIVNNESSEIIRILNSGVFDEFADPQTNPLDLVPLKLESQIEEINSWVYDHINNGVYKSGFAESQEVYEREVTGVFEHLDRLEHILSVNYKAAVTKYGEKDAASRLYLINEQLTEADLRLYPTIVRFDPVYVQHFKCNLSTIRAGYKMIDLWLRNMYWNHSAFRSTTSFDHIKLHYTRSHPRINPLAITPLGPKPDILPL
ncbi:S-glutathionyl-(chloro)hydroquinone reductase [Lachancea thermotolerans CBS 6340]|uniref:KLTH0F17622p n=1 Tax=Lachancea thermotolerans (strain ATCC 56472 / CBS 6340 / NRRL Y-8284) TaxID=559295 RepID=C5DJM4_LACTC|nr:KLTH0F17622p [Lachancea thermotolerans CBS 6340]CAR24513.1 KLTH0F17622p [Lachancea thermotolerans CBS 6340]